MSSSHDEDIRRQQLAAQLFTGVTDKPRWSAGRGHLAANRMSRNPGKTKNISPNPVMSPADNRSHSVQGTTSKTAGKSNMDLLLDIESTEGRDIEGNKACAEKGILLSTLDNTVDIIPSQNDETLKNTQESVGSDTHLVMNPSELGSGCRNTQKVCHDLFFFIYSFSKKYF